MVDTKVKVMVEKKKKLIKKLGKIIKFYPFLTTSNLH